MSARRLASFKESLDVLKETPELLSDFKTPFNNDEFALPEINIYLQNEDGQISGTPHKLKNIYPTFTVQDLLRALWVELGMPNEWIPDFVFLGIPKDEESAEYESVKGVWYYPYSQTTEDTLILPNPIQHIQSNTPLPGFVSEDGQREPMNFKARERTTIETLFLRANGVIPIIHAYNLTYLQRFYTGSRPYSTRAWYGLFNPFFPSIDENGPFEPTQQILNKSITAKEYIHLKIKEYNYAQKLLEELALTETKITAVRHLQFEFDTPENFEGADIQFYTVQTNKNIPYLRYVPATGHTMTKLYRPNELSLPYINDCELLRDWTNISIPSSVSEMLIGKVLISSKERDPGIYGTIRVIDNGKMDLTLQPPKNVRSIDFPRDIKSEEFSELVQKGLEEFNIDVNTANFVQASVNCGLSKEQGKAKYSKGRKYTTEISRQVLKERLQWFKTIFQEIQISEEEKGAQIMLRFKGVDNFDSEDRIEAYCTFEANKKFLEGEGINESLVKSVSYEFGLGIEEARSKVAAWLSKKTEETIGGVDSKELQAFYNPGTDIAVYLQHPDYTFHIYRVESLENLQRIIALMTILLDAPDDRFMKAPPEKTSMVVQVEESKVQEKVGDDVELADVSAGAGSAGAGSGDVYNFDEGLEETNEEELSGRAPIPEKPSASLLSPKQEMSSFKGAEDEDDSALAEEGEGEGENRPIEQRKIVAYGFFINRLKELDKTLFEFKPATSADKAYSTLCQANVTVQPLGLNEQEYKRMKNMYKDDIDENKMIFIEYGSDNLEEQLRTAKNVVNPKNRFSVVKYGTSPENKNYYLCARYFCLNDYVVLLPDEFKKAGNWRGINKKENECPFCRAKIIPKERLAPKVNPLKNEAVLERIVKPKSDEKIAEYIRFLRQGKHPQGFELPCCYTKEPTGKELSRLTSLSSKKGKVKAPIEEDEDTDDDSEDGSEMRLMHNVEYDALRYKVSQIYIKDPVKYPLAPGTLGQCSTAIDEFFGQESQDIIERISIQQKLKPSSEGFLRLGVQVSSLEISTSLFSALAPILNQRSWREVAEFMKNAISPRTFINLNFGNLLLEFYELALSKPLGLEKELSDTVVSEWASRFIKADMAENRIELNRFYLSYRRFIRYLINPTEQKQLRHFYHALSEPGLLTTNGITLIVLEYKGNPSSPDVEIEVKCPSLGFDISRYSRNDIAFVTHDQKGFWEPIAYIHKEVIPATKVYKQEAFYKFTWQQLSTIAPQAVRERVQEFMRQCSSSYRGFYTSQSHVDSRLLIPISVALKSLGSSEPVGIVRDAYNHLVAITLPATADKAKTKQSREIVVPVADDGYIAHKDQDLRIHVSWKSVENNLASADEVYRIYESVIKKRLLPLSKQYAFVDFLKEGDTVRAFRIGMVSEDNPPIVLPCLDGPVPEGVAVTVQDSVNYPYNEETKYVLSEEAPKEEQYSESADILKKEQVEELYQTFRLTFANWLVTSQYRAELRKELKRIINPANRLPLYEQRRRLEILIGPILQSWLYPDPEEFEIVQKLRRVNCLQFKDSGGCEGNGICKWVEAEGSGKCLLHIPSKVDIGHGDVTKVFIYRLIDELVRLPIQRSELLTNRVKKVQPPKKAMQLDDQYILPINAPEMDELFQLICQKKLHLIEEPRFYEEFSIDPDEVKYSQDYQQIGRLAKIPAGLAELLTSENANRLRLLVVDEPGVVDKTEKLSMALEKINMAEFNKYRKGEYFTDGNISYISRIIKLPIIQFLVNPPDPALKTIVATYGSLPFREGVVIFVPDAEQGPGFVVLADQRKPQIPIDYIEGGLKEMILKTKPRRPILERKMPGAKPTLQLPNNSNDEESASPPPVPPVPQAKPTLLMPNNSNSEEEGEEEVSEGEAEEAVPPVSSVPGAKPKVVMPPNSNSEEESEEEVSEGEAEEEVPSAPQAPQVTQMQNNSNNSNNEVTFVEKTVPKPKTLVLPENSGEESNQELEQ